MRPLFQQNLIVDFKNLVFRSYMAGSGQQALTTADGRPSGHVFRFVNTVVKLKQFGGHLHFCLEGGEQLRYQLYPEYKGARAARDFDPVPDCLRIVRSIKCSEVQPIDAEADDAIAALVRGSKDKNVVFSGDNDLLSLLGPRTRVSAYGEERTEADVLKKYKVKPAQLALAKALTGDSSDNIPGVPGLRWKSIEHLIPECTTPNDLYERVDHVSGKSRDLLLQYRDQVELMFKVVTLRPECQLVTTEHKGDKVVLRSILDEFQCKSLHDKVSGLL